MPATTPALPVLRSLARLGYLFPSWSNVTPFTYQDGQTFAKMLESLIAYVDNDLVPYIDANMLIVTDAWKTTIEALIEELTNGSIELQDPVIAGLLADAESATRVALDALIAGLVTDPEKDGVFTLRGDTTNTFKIIGAKTTGELPAIVKTWLDGRFEPLDSAYTKAEADARYEPLDSAYTKAEGDARYMLASAGATDAELAAAVASLTSGINGKVISGVLADRPAYNSVPVNTVYVATDVAEQYISTGSTWAVFGSGGNELASAAYGGPVVTTPNKTDAASGGSITNIAGFQLSFKAGYRPIRIDIFGRVAMTAANQGVMVHVLLNGNQLFNISEGSGPDVDRWRSFAAFQRVNGLTPGSVNTVTVGISVPSGFTGSARLDSGVLEVVTL